MGRLFDLEASGYFYSRLQNPTCDYVAAKIRNLEGGNRRHADLLRSGGQLLRPVQHRLLRGSHRLLVLHYGGTFNLISVTMAKMGIEVTFVSPDCTDAELEGRLPPQHEGRVRRDHRQSRP